MGERRPPEKANAFPIAGSGVFPLLAALILVLIVCSYLIVRHWPQGTSGPVAGVVERPIQGPGGAELASFDMPAGYSVIYEQQQRIVLLSTTNGVSRTLETPGYIYNRAITPIVTPDHELIYGGDGIWITSLVAGHPRRLAALPADQALTSLVLSSDGTMLAWSSVPRTGVGNVIINVEPRNDPARVVRVYQHPAGQCPCFRVFSFSGASSLLLTNDQGDQRLVQYGLWRFDLHAGAQSSSLPPQPLLASDVQQGPLLFAPQSNTLLYTSYEGFVPMPASGVPGDITSLNYANSLLVASISQARENLEGQRVILPEQQALSGPAAYRWVATPQLSPDGHTLAYGEFSSGDRSPFARHYALYSASLHNASRESPQLLATASASYIELGPWLTSHMLTFYAQNALYVLDVQHNALATLTQAGTYARIIAVVEG